MLTRATPAKPAPPAPAECGRQLGSSDTSTASSGKNCLFSCCSGQAPPAALPRLLLEAAASLCCCAVAVAGAALVLLGQSELPVDRPYDVCWESCGAGGGPAPARNAPQRSVKVAALPADCCGSKAMLCNPTNHSCSLASLMNCKQAGSLCQ